MIRRWYTLLTLTSTAVFFLTCSQSEPTTVEWRWYGSDIASSKYIGLSQIDRSNVHDLRVAWRWNSIDNMILNNNPDLRVFVNEATPLMVNGMLYTSTALSQVAAISPMTGQTIWSYDPGTYEDGTPANVGFVHRGVAYWEEGSDKRILYATGDGYLIALDANSGEPIDEFGANGRVDLTVGLRRPIDRAMYAVSSPPVICSDVLVVGGTVLDAFGIGSKPQQEMPPGDVRGFDVRTGQSRWTFETIPQVGSFGNETWQDNSWETTGNTNVWTWMTADENLGYVYLPISTPTNDFYGGERKGNNLFAESLVCLDAETGERVWHFQMVHHGIWDYDLPAAPNLVDVTVEGQRIHAVAQVSKQGFCYVLNRETGEAVWPIEERPVPHSTVSGEESSPTQPYPTRPSAFERQGLTEEDLIDFTPELREEAKQILRQYDSGPIFTAPSEKGTVMMPGLVGGASWAGAAVNPSTGTIYIPSYTLPSIATVHASTEPDDPYAYTGSYAWGPTTDDGLPIVKPPYGRITAIDLNTGQHLWMSPVGNGPRMHPRLRDLNLPPLGWDRRTFPLLTDTLLFAAQMGIVKDRAVSARGNAMTYDSNSDEAYLRAFDPESGDLIAEISLPENATGSPMSYMVDGRQYILVPVGGASQPAEFITLTLP